MTVVERINIQLELQVAKLSSQLKSAQSMTAAATRQMSAEWAITRNSILSASNAISGMAVVAIGGFAAASTRDLGTVIDTWNLVNSRIRLVTDSTEDLKEKQKALFAISQKTRTGYEATAALYSRMARNTKQAHIESSRLLTVTEAIAKALIISGAAANSADAALIQLTQGFAANALRGQELNSVMEQIPRVSEAIATGMGVSIGRLRALAAEGKLTTDIVIKALESQAAAIDKEFTTMQRTMGQAALQTKNQWAAFLGELDKSLLITKNVTELFDILRESLKDQNKEVAGVQNAWERASKGIVVWTVWTVDQLILAYASITTVWSGITPFFTMLWEKIKISTNYAVDQMVINAGRSLAALKLQTLSVVDELSGITVFGVQVSPDEVISADTLNAARAEVAAYEKELVEAHEAYNEGLRSSTAAFNRAVAADAAFLDAATRQALVSIDDRYAQLEAKAKTAKVAAEALSAAYVKPAGIVDVGLSAAERKNVESLLVAYRKVNESLATRAAILDDLLRLQNREVSNLQVEEEIRDTSLKRDEQRLENIHKMTVLYAKLAEGATDKQRLEIEASVTALQTETYRIMINKERAQVKYQVALRKDLELQQQISQELLKQSRYEYDIRKDQGAGLIPEPESVDNEAALVELTERVNITRAYLEGLKTLEDTEANRLRILQAETALLRKQAALVKEQTKEQRELYKILQGIGSKGLADFFSTFAETGDLGDSIGAAITNALNDGLNTARVGTYGPTAMAGAYAVDVVRGLVNTSKADLEAQIKAAQGTVRFTDSSLAALGNVYSGSISPLLGLTRTTHHLLTLIDNSIKAAGKFAVETGFDPKDGRTPDTTSSLTGEDFKKEADSFLGGLSEHTRSLVAAGVAISEQRLVRENASFDVSGYQAVNNSHSQLFGLFSSSTVKRSERDLSDALQQEFTDIKANLVDSLRLAGESLSIDQAELERELRSVQIAQLDIELLGLSAEEASERLSDAWSTIMSGVVGDLEVFNDLVDQFAQGDEGRYETLMRIARDYQIAASSLRLANIDIPDNVIATSDIPLYNGLVESIRNANSEAMRTLYRGLLDDLKRSRQEITLALAAEAGGADRLASLAAAYAADFLTAKEIATRQMTSIASELAAVDIQLPDTKAAYRELVEAQDQTTEEGRKRLLLLLELAPMYSDSIKVLNEVAEANDKATESQKAVAEAQADAAKQAETLAAKYDNLYRSAITGATTAYTPSEQEALLRSTGSGDKSVDSMLADLKAATDAAFRTSPTREAYEARFNAYLDALQDSEQVELKDIYEKMDEVIAKLEEQVAATEAASYQEAL